MTVTIRQGDCREVLRTMPDQSVHMCCTSPPYFGLRDYGHSGQIGLEATPDAYVAEMVAVFGGVRRVLRDDGTLWLNLGDSYGRGERVKNVNDSKRGTGHHAAITAASGYGAGPRAFLRDKDMIGIPWRVAFALQADGWYLRQDIIWSKPNPMPESVTDRCTKAHEYIFLMSKSARYFYDADAVKEDSVTDDPRRNKRSVWNIATSPFAEAHFATFPPGLIEPCIKAGCPEGGTVLDPFGGAGTTALVADRLKRNAVLIELNPEYAAMAERRIRGDAGMFADVGHEAAE